MRTIFSSFTEKFQHTFIRHQSPGASRFVFQYSVDRVLEQSVLGEGKALPWLESKSFPYLHLAIPNGRSWFRATKVKIIKSTISLSWLLRALSVEYILIYRVCVRVPTLGMQSVCIYHAIRFLGISQILSLQFRPLYQLCTHLYADCVGLRSDLCNYGILIA